MSKDIIEFADLGLVDKSKSLVSNLSTRFVIPPFSVLDARQGHWQSRKKAWIGLGIQSELGRGEGLLKFSDQAEISRSGGTLKPGPLSYEIANNPSRRKRYAECLRTGIGEEYGRKEMSATSIFDPVICELVYRWFCPPGGRVIDPFAGGSVRGIVAGAFGLYYTGIDLSASQVAANDEQAKEIGPILEAKPMLGGKDFVCPQWVVGDGKDVQDLVDEKADLIFSCPPYGDLEVYSDDPRDLSNMDHDDFIDAYREVIANSISKLKPNRFAAFVVGDFRDKDGYYRNFPLDTIDAFEDAGAKLYNEIILVTAIGSLTIRVGKPFMKNRKVGKTHQNLYVFYKGDIKKIREDFPELLEE